MGREEDTSMRVYAGRRIGPIFGGVSGTFHPARVLLHHADDRVPSPLAWLIVLAMLLFTFGSFWLAQ